MQQKQRCSQCGHDYWAKMIMIFVFKQHICPIDKVPLVISGTPDKKIYTCPKCKKIVTKDNPVEFNNLGIRIQGSTRKFLERDQILAKDKTLEFEKVPVPEETSCMRCRNYATRNAQATMKREKKLEMGIADDIREIPAEVSDADLYKYEINKKLQTDYQEARKAEAYEKQKQERAAAEAERRKQLEQKMKNPETLMPNPEEIQPLVDPETMKIEQDAQAKDIRIEAYKKNIEVEKQLKADLKKKNKEIEKLKKKLENAKKE